MNDATIILLARFAAATIIGCVGVWQAGKRVDGDATMIALTALGAAAFIAVGHC